MWRLVLLMSTCVYLAACSDQDSTQLQVISYTPAADAVAVSTDTSVSALFSEPIAPSSVNSNNFTLSNQSGSLSGILQANGNTASFTPDKPLSLYSKYTATISPTIYGAFGRLLSQPYQWSFTTRDGIWESLSSAPQGSESDTCRVAIDDSGKVVLAWSNPLGTYASFIVNGTWTAPLLLGQGGYLNNVVASSDSFAVFWQVRNNNIIQMYCARFTGGEWQPTELFASVDASAFYITPYMFADNSLLAIYWFNGGADGSQAFSRRFITNQGWQASVVLAEQNARYVAGFHRSGKAVIAWTSPPSSSTVTGYAQSFDILNGWYAPVVIGQDTNILAHSAAVNSAGQAMVTFSTLSDVRVSNSTANGGWTQSTPVYQRQSGVLDRPPQIAVDSLGNAMLTVAFFSLSGTQYRYLAMRYDRNSGWQQPTEIGGGKFPDPMQFNAFQADEAGNYQLIWMGYDTLPGIRENIYSSRYQNGVGWKAPVSISRQDADAAFPKMSMNRRGEVAAVWPTFYPTGNANNFTVGLEVALFH